MVPIRTITVKACGIKSSYKNKKGNFILIENFGDGALVPPDMSISLQSIKSAVESQQGQLYITDLTRTWQQQKQANISKPNLAKKPGTSLHQGRSCC